MTQKTILNDTHRALGAKMVDFGGWDMPLHYGSQVDEHHLVRRDAGMFDVSHMTVVDLRGAGPQRERGPEYVIVLVSEHFDGVPWLERVYVTGRAGQYAFARKGSDVVKEYLRFDRKRRKRAEARSEERQEKRSDRR